MCEFNLINFDIIAIKLIANTRTLTKWRLWLKTQKFAKLKPNCLADYWRKQFFTNPETKKIICETWEDFLKKNNEKNKYPSLGTMLQSFTESVTEWAKKGFKVVNEKQFNDRLNICKGCELWDKEALGGSGRCTQCGCSTQAKLRIATEKCPVDKWGPVINKDQPTV
jgi:hypothetical protein